jgi:hypothetical protein
MKKKKFLSKVNRRMAALLLSLNRTDESIAQSAKSIKLHASA